MISDSSNKSLESRIHGQRFICRVMDSMSSLLITKRRQKLMIIKYLLKLKISPLTLCKCFDSELPPQTARGGRVRSTTSTKDRYIVLSAKRNRRTTAQQVANQFLAASGKQISRKTVARRLRSGGLYTRRPVVCPIDQTAPYCPFAMVSCASQLD
ncbi:hypothetical protein TNCV_3432731 [Trichonephila clavipes]|nr:hypothetical protein TNCV_3432731 [Trichonephila clavipes]